MANIVIATQSTASVPTPASGQATIFVDATSKKLVSKDDAGVVVDDKAVVSSAVDADLVGILDQNRMRGAASDVNLFDHDVFRIRRGEKATAAFNRLEILDAEVGIPICETQSRISASIAAAVGIDCSDIAVRTVIEQHAAFSIVPGYDSVNVVPGNPVCF